MNPEAMEVFKHLKFKAGMISLTTFEKQNHHIFKNRSFERKRLHHNLLVTQLIITVKFFIVLNTDSVDNRLMKKETIKWMFYRKDKFLTFHLELPNTNELFSYTNGRSRYTLPVLTL